MKIKESKGEKNMNLKILRKMNCLSQVEMARKLKISTPTYIRIEKGQNKGRIGFWQSVQQVFHINKEDMWDLIQNQNKTYKPYSVIINVDEEFKFLAQLFASSDKEAKDLAWRQFKDSEKVEIMLMETKE